MVAIEVVQQRHGDVDHGLHGSHGHVSAQVVARACRPGHIGRPRRPILREVRVAIRYVHRGPAVVEVPPWQGEGDDHHGGACPRVAGRYSCGEGVGQIPLRVRARSVRERRRAATVHQQHDPVGSLAGGDHVPILRGDIDPHVGRDDLVDSVVVGVVEVVHPVEMGGVGMWQGWLSASIGIRVHVARRAVAAGERCRRFPLKARSALVLDRGCSGRWWRRVFLVHCRGTPGPLSTLVRCVLRTDPVTLPEQALHATDGPLQPWVRARPPSARAAHQRSSHLPL